MPVALADLGFAISFLGEAAFGKTAGISAEAHGAAELLDSFQFAQLVDDAIGRTGVEFSGIRASQRADVASVLDDHGLHPETDAEIGDALFARAADSIQHTRNASLAEASRNEYSVKALEEVAAGGPLDVLGFN